MPTLLLYIVKLSCSLSIAWLFYRIFLHSLTFYNLNRWYLLGYPLLSFIIPFINIGPIDRENPSLQPLIVQYIPVIGKEQVVRALSAPEPSAWSWPAAALVLVAIGSSALLLRLLIRCLSLRRMRQRADLLEDGQIKIYQVHDHISPFSFGNAIYINTSQHSEKEKEEIILHEYVHIRQRHTLDILLAEFITIFNWYNPFAWLIRYSIRQNLEFIADQQVVGNGIDKKAYQYHLLKVIGQAQYRLANNFNFSSLKKRIVMMNKMRSARLNLLKFLFILPLLAVMLVAFRDRYGAYWHHAGKTPAINLAGIVFDVESRKPLPGVTVMEKRTGLRATSDDRGFYKFSIPVLADSIHVDLEFIRPGYDSTSVGDFFYSVKAPMGRVWVVPMHTPAYNHPGLYMGFPFSKKLPENPVYEDAVMVWKDQLKWNDDYAHFLKVQKAHPEVSLFYTTEDVQKHLVIHKDGSVERYGYPDGPTVADMEEKYGALPGFMKPSASVNPGPIASPAYLSRWAAISTWAERDFHTTNPTARAIIFPGDSRVIAIAADGMARFYDMDNDDPTERPAFEKTYGKLPDCVPPAFHYNDHLPKQQQATRALPVGQQPMAADADTVPAAYDTLGRLNPKSTIRVTNFSINFTPPVDSPHIQKNEPLYIVDGKQILAADISAINANDIASIKIIKNEAAVATYGPKARNGVILITLLPLNHIQSVLDNKSARHPITIPADTLHKKDSVRIWLRG